MSCSDRIEKEKSLRQLETTMISDFKDKKLPCNKNEGLKLHANVCKLNLQKKQQLKGVT